MNFFKFVFSFLYVRNWHTGQRELSRPRLLWFVGVIGLVLMALVMINFLQAPVAYSSANIA